MTEKKRKTNSIAAKSTDTINSVAALAKALGMSKRTLDSWVVRQDWIFGNAPWDKSIVERVQKWSNETIQATGRRALKSPKTEHEAELKRRKIEEQVRKLQLENDETIGRLHDKNDCLTNRMRAILEMKQALLEYCNTAPGLTNEQRENLTKHTEQLLHAFAGSVGVKENI